MSERITLPARNFQASLKSVTLACSKDEERPVLQRVRVIVSPARVRLESADGFRSHRIDIWDDHGNFSDYEGIVTQFTCLLTPEQIQAILKYKITRKDDPSLTLDPARGCVLINGKPLAGTFDTESNYPDIDCLYPKRGELTVTVNPQELLSAVKAARVYSREGTNIVQLHISDSIVVYARSEETGESWTVVPLLKVNRIDRHDIAIGFNADFLVDYLKSAAGEVKIQVNKPTQPAIFTDKNEYTALIMPMHFWDGHFDTVKILTPADVPAESRYNTTDSFVWPDPEPLKHDTDHGVESGYISDDIWTPSTPEPGAVIYEINTVWSFEDDAPRYGKNPHTKVVVFHLANPTPDPDAPIAVDLSTPAARHPLFATTKNAISNALSIGECSRCTDPNHHALIDGLCNACRQELHALDLAARFTK